VVGSPLSGELDDLPAMELIVSRNGILADRKEARTSWEIPSKRG